MKIIEMSEQEIDALKTIIDELELTDEHKAAITYGLNLIIWLPKLILEQRISLHRLQLMLFGKAAPAKKSKNDNKKKTGNNKSSEDNQVPSDNATPANDEYLDITESPDLEALVNENNVQIWKENTSEGTSLYILDPDFNKLEIHAASLLDRLAHIKNHPYEQLKLNEAAVEILNNNISKANKDKVYETYDQIYEWMDEHRTKDLS